MGKLLTKLKAMLAWCDEHYPGLPVNEAQWRVWAFESAEMDEPMPSQNLAAKHLWQFDVKEGIRPFEEVMDF